ncbi:hypothetical protein Tcan_00646, partial [Toxocara canis]
MWPTRNFVSHDRREFYKVLHVVFHKDHILVVAYILQFIFLFHNTSSASHHFCRRKDPSAAETSSGGNFRIDRCSNGNVKRKISERICIANIWWRKCLFRGENVAAPALEGTSVGYRLSRLRNCRFESQADLRSKLFSASGTTEPDTVASLHRVDGHLNMCLKLSTNRGFQSSESILAKCHLSNRPLIFVEHDDDLSECDHA